MYLLDVAVPVATKLYGERVVWQQDPATIHRTEAALEAFSAFASRIPHEALAPKMADIWPVENIWSIVKEMIKSKEPKNKAQLKTILPRVWREINSDKALCKRLMKSIPPGLKL
jgi:hypothetical protein